MEKNADPDVIRFVTEQFLPKNGAQIFEGNRFGPFLALQILISRERKDLGVLSPTQ